MRKLIHRIRNHEMPLGLKLILCFYVYTLVVDSWSFFREPSVIFLGEHYTGAAANWISFVFLLIDLAWVVALVRRLKWGWKLFIAWNLLGLPVGFVTTLQELIYLGRVKLLAMSVYFALLFLVVLVCAYVYQKRYYFSK
jgi:hypothetical protein